MCVILLYNLCLQFSEIVDESGPDNEDESDDEEKEVEDDIITDEVLIEDRKDGDMEIKQLDLNELIEHDTSSSENENDDVETKEVSEIGKQTEINVEKKKKVKDSFFLGGAGDDASGDAAGDAADDAAEAAATGEDGEQLTAEEKALAGGENREEGELEGEMELVDGEEEKN